MGGGGYPAVGGWAEKAEWKIRGWSGATLWVLVGNVNIVTFFFPQGLAATEVSWLLICYHYSNN